MKGKGGEWTIEDLNKFLTNPKAIVPGTNMKFAGLPRGSERADMINYLHTTGGQPGAAAQGRGSAPMHPVRRVQ